MVRLVNCDDDDDDNDDDDDDDNDDDSIFNHCRSSAVTSRHISFSAA